MDDFEAAFSDYLDSRAGDEAEAALFTVMRSAFRAGWRAAESTSPNPAGTHSSDPVERHKVIRLDPPKEK